VVINAGNATPLNSDIGPPRYEQRFWRDGYRR
jgi:hypothetical protein